MIARLPIACLRSSRFDSIIDAKLGEGRDLGVTSTPTLFINGAVVTGVVPLSRLEQLIRDELRSLARLNRTWTWGAGSRGPRRAGPAAVAIDR
jgi:hypothetical protein